MPFLSNDEASTLLKSLDVRIEAGLSADEASKRREICGHFNTVDPRTLTFVSSFKQLHLFLTFSTLACLQQSSVLRGCVVCYHASNTSLA